MTNNNIPAALVAERDTRKDKLLRDLAVALPLLSRVEAGGVLSDIERFTLLRMIGISYHDDGKIAGLASVDSSARGCEFCAMMQAAAADLKARGCDDHICGKCYATRGRFLLADISDRLSLTMAILSMVEFSVDDFKALGLVGLVRIHSDGDVRNDLHALNLLRMVIASPYARFAWWGKNILPIIRACDALGKPDNLTLIASSPMIGRAVRLPRYFDYTFTVYRPEQVSAALAAGAGACNGRRCAACGFRCYVRGWADGQNIAEKLR